MYIRFNTQNKKIVYMGENKPLNVDTDLYKVAEFDGEIPQGDYLTVGNIQSLTRVVNPAHTETIINDEGKEEVVEIPEERETYLSCQVVGNKYTYTAEQIEAQKLKRYNTMVTQLVRLKYDANAVEALLANYAENKVKYQEEFDAFAEYRKECKLRAREEVYGK